MHSVAEGPVTRVPREFAFTARDFERIREMIRRRAGISLGSAKRNMVYSRVSRLLRSGRFASFRDYLDRLESAGTAHDWQAFVNALTTNLTSFFREAHHFPILARHLQSWARERWPAVVWCAAASSGEEAYSIAITACEAFDTLTPPVRIIASDIDTAVLAKAAQGIYPIERTQAVGVQRLRRFFQRGTGARAGHARVRPEVRALVQFEQVNLLDDAWRVPDGLAALFCRNVLIYFDRATQARVVARFLPLLADDGLLFAGHSESLSYAQGEFDAHGHTVYGKRRARVA